MRNEITELYKMAPCLKRVAKWMVFDLNIALLWTHNPTLSFHKYLGGGGGGSAQKSEADNSQDYFCTTETTKRGLLPEFDWCRDVTHDAYTRSTKLYALRCAGDVSLLLHVRRYLQSYVPQSLVFCLTLGSVTSAFGPKKCIARKISPSIVEFLVVQPS